MAETAMATAAQTFEVPNLHQSTDFWDLSQRTVAAQRAGRYLPDRVDDPKSLKAGRTWPDVAGAIIDTYSEPGATMYAPMCGTGVELVEAIWRNRFAVGLELLENRLERACLHLMRSKTAGALGHWNVDLGDARDGYGIEWDFRARFGLKRDTPLPSLIFIDPPFSETRMDGGPSRFNGVLHNYTGEDRIKGRAQRDPRNLGNLRHTDYLVEMTKVYDNCLAVAAPGAYLAVIVKDYRKNFRRIDLLGDTRRICEETGWRYYDRATLYLGSASHHQRRNAQANQHLLPITQDLLVFKKGR